MEKADRIDNKYKNRKSFFRLYHLPYIDTMAQFHHPHIISLIGVAHGGSGDEESSVGPPFASDRCWLVMELAPLGELRAYLQREAASMRLVTQLLFCRQLASALAHMHARGYVHRDVAARNCLVANTRCVKLSDFGLSRRIVDETTRGNRAMNGATQIGMRKKSLSENLVNTYCEMLQARREAL